VVSTQSVAKPVRGVGEFFAMSLDTFVQMFRPPWAWREFILQTWFVARVALLPTILLSIPFTVLVIAGAAATAMCADLGSRTIREELDALRVLGINPVQALVVPRVLAATLVSSLLACLVCLVGITGGFIFSVYFQNVTPGAFVAGLTLLVKAPAVITAIIKAAMFGMAASLIACYKGISVGGGPQGVGNAVNETVVYTFMALFVINLIATAVAVKAGAT